jgi:hypothetical protein
LLWYFKKLFQQYNQKSIKKFEIINDLLAYDFGDQYNTLLENAAAAFENFDYNTARESLNEILP